MTEMTVDATTPLTPRSARELPRVLTFGLALTCGLLIALAFHILLTNAGWGLGSVWRAPPPSPSAGLHSAVAWWLIAAGAFVGSWAIGRLTDGHVRTWRRSQGLRRLMGFAFVVALAIAGHAAGTSTASGAGMAFAVNLAAAGLGIMMAFLGAYFAVRTLPGMQGSI
jgi:hypothetical protein